MANVMIDAACDQRGGFLECQQRRFAFALLCGLSARAQRMNSKSKRYDGNDQQRPCNDLVPGEWLIEPEVHIEYDKPQNRFPGEEAEKAMRARIA